MRSVLRDFAYGDVVVPGGRAGSWSRPPWPSPARGLPRADRYDPDRFGPARQEDRVAKYSADRRSAAGHTGASARPSRSSRSRSSGRRCSSGSSFTAAPRARDPTTPRSSSARGRRAGSATGSARAALCGGRPSRSSRRRDHVAPRRPLRCLRRGRRSRRLHVRVLSGAAGQPRPPSRQAALPSRQALRGCRAAGLRSTSSAWACSSRARRAGGPGAAEGGFVSPSGARAWPARHRGTAGPS